MDVRAKLITRTHISLPCAALLLLAFFLYLTSLYNYLLFHTLAEIFSTVVACAIFIFAWNTRHIQTNYYFLFLGIAFLFTGGLDFLHCLSYKGMNIFAGIATEDLSCQLWIAARYLESASLLAAFFFLRRRPDEYVTAGIYFFIFCLILLAIFCWPVFPACHVEGLGLTHFKRRSEYLIALLLAASLLLLHKSRSSFDPTVLRLMQAAILFTIAAELSFSFYVTTYDLANIAGHFFRIFSCYSIYRAVIETGLTQPYNMLFRELSAHRAELEHKVQERTAALLQSAENLQEEVTERLKTEKDLLWELSVNRALAEVSDALLSQSASIRETEELVLRAAKHLTGCEYGAAVSAEMEPADQPVLFPLGDKGGYPGLWARPRNTLQGFYTNAIASSVQEAQQGLQKRILYSNYLNVPAVIDGKAVGQIALANKPGEFTRHDLAAVERLAGVFALSIQRKQMEESLQRSERKYKSLFSDAPDMIQIVNQEKKIVDVNPVELRTLGYAKNEFIGTSFIEAIHPDFQEKTARVFEHIFVTGKDVKSHETALLTKAGERVDVEMSAAPQIDGGRVVSVRAIMRNIADRKREELEKKKLEMQLRQSKKMEAIGTLAGGIAHDFNNILGPILGYTDMAIETLPAGSRITPWLQEVLHAGNRARDLVRQILTISRKTEQELQPLKIQLIIKETLKLLRSSLPSTIEIRQRLDPECEPVLADPTQIHQVIMNLCTNAYHAMRESGGILEVSLQRAELTAEDLRGRLRLPPGSYLKLEVRDTGCGMPEDILEKIFEPYFTTKAKGEGTGLGLALVQSITLDCGGDIAVSSRLGQGTVFHVYLPIIPTVQDDHQDSVHDPLPRGCERILVVDDDTDFARMNRNLLESLGYQAVALTGSMDALAAFRQQPKAFDLVMTDMTMPHMTGDEVSRQMLALRPDLPIVLCTGFSELIDEKKAEDIGICTLMMKPFTKRELAKTVRSALDRRRS